MIVDHLGMVPAAQGVSDPNFQALLKLVGDGHVYVKLSAVYRLSTQFPDYPDLLLIYQRLLPLAQKLGKKEEVERCQHEIQRLSPAPPAKS